MIAASPIRRRVVLASMLLALAVPAVAVAAVTQIVDGGATVSEPAVRLAPPIEDIVNVYDSGELDSTTEVNAVAAARQAGADFMVSDSASLAMQRIVRGSTVVQAAPSTLSIPMGTTVFDANVIAILMGGEVSDAVSESSIVMSRRTADLRGAESGDVVTLRSAFGADVDFTIGAVIADEITGGTELLITPEAASRLSLSRKSSVVMWGFDSRDAIDQAMVDNDLVSTRIRIRRSWDRFDPDSTLGMAETKELLGEFAYRVNSNGSVTQDSSWQAANLPSGRRNVGIGIIARCHLVIEPALRAAFDEIASVGAQTAFDVGDANAAGGCHVPRFNRLANSPSIGFLSRHSWGMAIDTNTRGSCQGCAPPNFVTRPGGCTAVRIMRKHGFAWGGNFLTPDGMHFEYVGEPRDQLPYPSRYCANIVDDNALTVEVTQRATLFDAAGLVAE
ncbi:MAG: M15 family metallopeptidase [Ilumatobacter sp.]|uniref:M15 family metallopeptidase n=1 Tax=Ilumatobacter sp. TaxID=1967498 RepID=UPI003C790F49